MNVDPLPSRLGFVAAARAGFDFVTHPPYSLWLAVQDEGRIDYESDKIALAVLHEWISYELDIALWRPAIELEIVSPYKMADLIRVTDPDKARAYRAFSASTALGIRNGITQLLADFRQYGLEALSGDADIFQRISSARTEAVRAYQADAADTTKRIRAEHAWRAKDLSEVVRWYEQIGDRLSAIERARLAYARKHRNG